MKKNCKFCLKEKELIKAHIIPRCFWGPLIKQEGPIHIIPTNLRERESRSQIGEYDPELVCEDCEEHFKILDNYACKFFMEDFDKLSAPIQNNDDRFLQIKNFDYEKLKLFFLSILWRASASERGYYSQVDVGEIYEEKLKDMIQNKQPDKFKAFQIIVSKFKPSTYSTIMLSPTRYRVQGARVYKFILGGFVAIIKVDQQPFSENLDFTSLKPNQPLYILQGDITELKEFHSSVQSIKKRYNHFRKES